MNNKVECPSCLGTKQVLTKRGMKKCNFCDKNGEVDPIKESAYINEVMPLL